MSRPATHTHRLARALAAITGNGYQSSLALVEKAAADGQLPDHLDPAGMLTAVTALTGIEPRQHTPRSGPAAPVIASNGRESVTLGRMELQFSKSDGEYSLSWNDEPLAMVVVPAASDGTDDYWTGEHTAWPDDPLMRPLNSNEILIASWHPEDEDAENSGEFVRLFRRTIDLDTP